MSFIYQKHNEVQHLLAAPTYQRNKVKIVTMREQIDNPYTDEEEQVYCSVLFDRDTCPHVEFKGYILDFHKCIQKRGKRNYTDDEYVMVQALQTVTLLVCKHFDHFGMRLAFMTSVENMLVALLALIENFPSL